MKKQITVSTFIYDSNTLEFQVSDLETNTMYYVVGDLESLEAYLFENYRVDKVLVNTTERVVAKSLKYLGFEVNIMDCVRAEVNKDVIEFLHFENGIVYNNNVKYIILIG